MKVLWCFSCGLKISNVTYLLAHICSKCEHKYRTGFLQLPFVRASKPEEKKIQWIRAQNCSSPRGHLRLPPKAYKCSLTSMLRCCWTTQHFKYVYSLVEEAFLVTVGGFPFHTTCTGVLDSVCGVGAIWSVLVELYDLQRGFLGGTDHPRSLCFSYDDLYNLTDYLALQLHTRMKEEMQILERNEWTLIWHLSLSF